MAFFGGGASVDLASPTAIGSTTPNTGAFTTLSANNGTITTNSPAFTLAQTWDGAGVTFTALRVNATDTASAFGSLLMDLQVGGSSRLNIRKDGSIIVPNTSGQFPVLSWPVNGSIECGGLIRADQRFRISSGANLQIDSGGVNTTGSYQFSASNATAAGDVVLVRDAANTLAQRNSTNAQTFRIYNTYTDASNYERGFMRWATNVLEIGAEAAGTGTQRQLRFPLGTVTASTPLSITQTWNSAGVTFTGIQANITDTASASGSLLMDLQVGGSSVFRVDKNGSAYVRQGAYNQSGLVFGTNLNTGIYFASPWFLFSNGGAVGAGVGQNGFLAAGSSYGFCAGGTVSSDLIITRDAANILAQRNSTNAQTFRLYRTYTDASNYERIGFIATRTTRFAIAAENAGTGAARSLEFSFYTSASDPTSTDITDGCFSVWKNSGTGTIKLWANDGGTMKSVSLA